MYFTFNATYIFGQCLCTSKHLSTALVHYNIHNIHYTPRAGGIVMYACYWYSYVRVHNWYICVRVLAMPHWLATLHNSAFWECVHLSMSSDHHQSSAPIAYILCCYHVQHTLTPDMKEIWRNTFTHTQYTPMYWSVYHSHACAYVYIRMHRDVLSVQQLCA